MKKILIILLTITIVLLSFGVVACSCSGDETENITSDGIEYVLINGKNEYQVKSLGTCTDKNVILAQKYNGKKVTEIADGAFQGNAVLTKIVIPKTITKIGQDAFAGCVSLIRVYYGGVDKTEWSNINVLEGNDILKNVAKYYYSKSKPTVQGNFWCFDESVPVIWVIGPIDDPYVPDIYD